jgi:hypothetical protein
MAIVRPENTNVRKDMSKPSAAVPERLIALVSERGRHRKSVMKMTCEHSCFPTKINVCARGHTALYAAPNIAKIPRRNWKHIGDGMPATFLSLQPLKGLLSND